MRSTNLPLYEPGEIPQGVEYGRGNVSVGCGWFIRMDRVLVDLVVHHGLR